MASGDECCGYGYEDGEEGEWDGAELEAGEDDSALLEEAPPPERLADCWDYIMEGKKPTKVTIEDLEEYNLIVLKEFGSEEEGFIFYNSYAEGKGFSVRKDIVKRDPTTGRIVRRRYYCSREGYRRIQFFDLPNRQKEPRPLTRCGCEAEFEIELNEETGRWFVKNFKDEHKHSLARPGEVAFVRSHRGLSDAQKADAIEFQVGGIRKYQIMEVMEKQHGGYEKVGFILADLYNFFKRYNKEPLYVFKCTSFHSIII